MSNIKVKVIEKHYQLKKILIKLDQLYLKDMMNNLKKCNMKNSMVITILFLLKVIMMKSE